MAGVSISFDGHSLQTDKILVQTIDHENIPLKDAKLYALAHASASRIPFTSYPNKSITITGQIYDDTITDLDATLDLFRSYFMNQDANLDIAYGNSTRRYIATVNSLQIDRPGGLTSADFTIQFICTQPFGQDTGMSTVLSVSGRTSASYTDVVTFSGTAPWQRPIVTIVYATVSGTGTVSFGNNSNGQQLTVSGTRSNGDTLVFDSRNKSVQLNGSDVAFTGAFPEFPPGLQAMAYSDGLSSRNFSYTVQYYPMYL